MPGSDFWGASGDAPSVLQKKYWAMNEDSILLEQCCKLDKRDLRIFEAFCGAVGGWTRSTSWLHDNGFGVSIVFFLRSVLLRCDLRAKKVPGRAPYSQHIIIRNWTKLN